MPTRLLAMILLGLGVLGPSPVLAQGFGLGPRMSWVRGDLPSGTPSTRFLGGTIRMSSSKRVALEAAMDYRTERTLDGLARLREVPLQGSLLLFPVRSTFSPYLLAGFGMYTQTAQQLDAAGEVISSFSTRETGAHAGVGAEIFVSRHAALFADYRFRFIRFGEPDAGDDPVGIPGLPGLPGLPGIDKLKISHRGSMWTTGVAFYF